MWKWFVVLCLMLTVQLVPWEPKSLVGLILGSAVCLSVNTIAGEENPLIFEPERFMTMLLPPIVLLSGLEFEWEEFKNTGCVSMLLASLGTVFTAVYVGGALYVLADVPLIQAMWLGAVLSPTDPVATCSLTRHAKLPKYLRNVVQHESLLNDAFGVMLVHLFETLWRNSVTPSKKETALLSLKLLGLMLLSAVFGAVAGRMSRQTSHVSVLVASFIVYVSAEMVGGSGILAIFVFGTTIQGTGTLRRVVEIVAAFSETYVYVSMGSTIMALEGGDAWVVFVALVSLWAGRVLAVATCTCCRWSLNDSVFVAANGARGAISLALAVGAPTGLRGEFITVAFLAVFVSTTCTFCAVKCMARAVSTPVLPGI